MEDLRRRLTAIDYMESIADLTVSDVLRPAAQGAAGPRRLLTEPVMRSCLMSSSI